MRARRSSALSLSSTDLPSPPEWRGCGLRWSAADGLAGGDDAHPGSSRRRGGDEKWPPVRDAGRGRVAGMASHEADVRISRGCGGDAAADDENVTVGALPLRGVCVIVSSDDDLRIAGAPLVPAA